MNGFSCSCYQGYGLSTDEASCDGIVTSITIVSYNCELLHAYVYRCG